MKKLLTVILALTLILSMLCAASAEATTYTLTAMIDEESQIYGVTEEFIVTLTVDVEAQTCALTSDEVTTEGTLVISSIESGDTAYIMTFEAQSLIMYGIPKENYLIASDGASSNYYLFEDRTAVEATEAAEEPTAESGN